MNPKDEYIVSGYDSQGELTCSQSVHGNEVVEVVNRLRLSRNTVRVVVDIAFCMIPQG